MNTEHVKHRLEEELRSVEKELSSVAAQNPETGDWEAKEVSMDTQSPIAEANEAGDKIEEYENNRGINNALEGRWRDIKDALAKIEAGTYGTCEVGGEAIEEDRLEANPAARTCKAHM